nr:LamB/YcsF family protein [Allgaiera sp.]
LGAAQAMARRAGGRVRHLKLHGALANMASEAPEIARACYSSALAVDPEIILVVLAATPMEAVARDLGARRAGEIFADRAYEDDATLVDRRKPGAVLHDPELAGKRMDEMLRAGAIVTASGKHIPCRIDTICVHGDSAEAVAMARGVRTHLEGAGIAVARF